MSTKFGSLNLHEQCKPHKKQTNHNYNWQELQKQIDIEFVKQIDNWQQELQKQLTTRIRTTNYCLRSKTHCDIDWKKKTTTKNSKKKKQFEKTTTWKNNNKGGRKAASIWMGSRWLGRFLEFFKQQLCFHSAESLENRCIETRFCWGR